MVHSCPAVRARQAGLSLLALMLGVGMVAIPTGIAAQLRLPDDPDDVGRGAMRDPRGNACVFEDYVAGESPDPSRRDRCLDSSFLGIC